jgi:hypothetical protein
VCGSSAVCDGVKEVIKKIYTEKCKSRGEVKSVDDVGKWFEGLKGASRLALDVFN